MYFSVPRVRWVVSGEVDWGCEGDRRRGGMAR